MAAALHQVIPSTMYNIVYVPFIIYSSNMHNMTKSHIKYNIKQSALDTNNTVL